MNKLGVETLVKRNDAISLQAINELQPSHIIISPGPKTPSEAGISLEVIRSLGETIPILGVCLGHQAIGQAYGGLIKRAKYPMHGKSSIVIHDQKNLFDRLENPLRVGRYHSLIISKENFPQELKITGRCDKGEIMAVEHRSYPVYGVQFHPESILTNAGDQLLKNFLTLNFKT